MDQEIKSVNNAAKFAFYYVLSLVALIFMSFGVGITLFQIINKFIVDVINEFSATYDPDALKFAISALLISSPIFYVTMREIHKNLFSGVLAKNSEVRKWLSYFILLVSSVVMIGWFIYVVNSFLGGELSLKIGLKALVAIAINAGIFSFYLYDIKRDEVAGAKDKVIRIYLYVSLVIVVAVFISALFVVESPTETRNRKIDERVLNNFSMIENAITMHYDEFKKLPENLEEIKKTEGYMPEENFQNPLSKKAIEYKVTGEQEYELCTDFLASNRNPEENGGRYMVSIESLHDAGYQCLKKRARNMNDAKFLDDRIMEAEIVQ